MQRKIDEENYEKAQKIASEFDKHNPELAKLYASLKTFKLNEDFVVFARIFKTFRSSMGV